MPDKRANHNSDSPGPTEPRIAHAAAAASAAAAANAHKVLQISALVTGYDKKQVVNGVSIDVEPNKTVAVIGHNGAGKSTLLKAVFGLIPIWSGDVFHNDEEIRIPHPRKWLERGVVYVPQGSRVFGDMSVHENLRVAAIPIGNKKSCKEAIEQSLSDFPKLTPRLRQRASTLSGGEKQMLALACAWVLSPRLLLLDEPSLGLAPTLVTEVMDRLVSAVKTNNVSVMIVEQKVREVLKIADSVCVLRNGSVSYLGPADELRDDEKLKNVYL